MKKIIAVALIITSCMVVTNVKAVSIDSSALINEAEAPKRLGDFVYTIDGEGARIIKYCGQQSKITIPKSLGGYPVRTIGWALFENYTKLEAITLPNTIESIIEFAFWNCPKLKSINIPENVRFIDCHVFKCNSLEKITVDKDNGYFTGIRNMLFSIDKKKLLYSAKNLKGSVVLPDEVEWIADYAFDNCKQITSIRLPASLYCARTFIGCSSLKKIEVDSKNKVYKSQNNALLSKDGSRLYEIPEGITGKFTIPSGVMYMDGKTFNNCKNITEINIPKSFINATPLWGLKSLKSINVHPDNSYFSSRNNVLFNKKKTELIYLAGKDRKQYEIPQSIITIMIGAFIDCDSLTKLTVSKGNTAYRSIDNVLFSKDKTNLIYSIETKTRYTVPTTVKQISDYAFFENKNLSGINIPTGVELIRSYAFYGCRKLKDLKISSKTGIYEYAFSNCTALKDFVSLQPYLELSCDQGLLLDKAYSGLAVSIKLMVGKKLYWSKTLNFKDPTGLPVPNKTGKTFIGWYTKSIGGEKITTINSAAKSMTLYARFK